MGAWIPPTMNPLEWAVAADLYNGFAVLPPDFAVVCPNLARLHDEHVDAQLHIEQLFQLTRDETILGLEEDENIFIQGSPNMTLDGAGITGEPNASNVNLLLSFTTSRIGQIVITMGKDIILQIGVELGRRWADRLTKARKHPNVRVHTHTGTGTGQGKYVGPRPANRFFQPRIPESQRTFQDTMGPNLPTDLGGWLWRAGQGVLDWMWNGGDITAEEQRILERQYADAMEEINYWGSR